VIDIKNGLRQTIARTFDKIDMFGVYAKEELLGMD
jgi:hypothetical protein